MISKQTTHILSTLDKEVFQNSQQILTALIEFRKGNKNNITSELIETSNYKDFIIDLSQIDNEEYFEDLVLCIFTDLMINNEKVASQDWAGDGLLDYYTEQYLKNSNIDNRFNKDFKEWSDNLDDNKLERGDYSLLLITFIGDYLKQFDLHLLMLMIDEDAYNLIIVPNDIADNILKEKYSNIVQSFENHRYSLNDRKQNSLTDIKKKIEKPKPEHYYNQSLNEEYKPKRISKYFIIIVVALLSVIGILIQMKIKNQSSSDQHNIIETKKTICLNGECKKYINGVEVK